MKFYFSWRRLLAVLIKEFIQLVRDKATLAMMIGIPIIQLVLFGFAINTNPRHLPTVLLANDHSPYTRLFIKAMENTEYFKFIEAATTEKQAQSFLDKGKALFVVTIPPNFTRDLISGKKPQILVEADATDPVAIYSAIAALQTLSTSVFDEELKGLARAPATTPPYEIVIHQNYNPEAITAYNIVPALVGVTLTLTMVFITALAMTRERERGTMENLLATPVRPLEVIFGKIAPYIIIGYVQIILILLIAHFVFFVPITGSISLLLVAAFPFIAANLAMGLTFSTIARNQLQAVQGAMFFFLPSILLSGFMFPFYGMPIWAQWIGSALPLTHFIRIIRGILLKGNDFSIVLNSLWPILIFTLIVILIGLKRFRQTLD